ncbi:YqzL family protein [Paraliobacillus sediminis]|nr:YqzL family protein [Paraliobacillus sediminis]
MVDISWKVFSQTGNIETYLLMKELETVYHQSGTEPDNEAIQEYDNLI